METTLIQNIYLKDFLSNIKAEAELTTHLAVKTTDHKKGLTKKFQKFIVTSGRETNGNTCVSYTQSRRGNLINTVGHALSIGKDVMSLHLHPSDGPNVTRPTMLYIFQHG